MKIEILSGGLKKKPEGIKAEIISGGLKKTEEPSTLSSLGEAVGPVARTAVSGATGFAGVPGNLASLASKAAEYIYQTGHPASTLSSPEAQKRSEELSPRTHPFEKIESYLPTTERIRQVLPESLTKPQSEVEEISQEIASDIGGLLFPIGPKLPFQKAAKLALGGNAAKYLTKHLGGSEAAQEGAKFGTMLLTSIGLQKPLIDKAKEIYSVLESSPILEESININPINKVINSIESLHLEKGAHNIPSKEILRDVIRDWKVNVGHDRTIGNVWKFRKDLAEKFYNAPPEAKPYLIKFSNSIDEALKNNPEVPRYFKDHYTEANQIYSGVKNAEQARDWMTGILKKFSKPSKIGATYALLSNPTKTVPLVGAAIAVKEGLKQAAYLGGSFKELFKNAGYRNAFAQMLQAAAKEQKRPFLVALRKINNMETER